MLDFTESCAFYHKSDTTYNQLMLASHLELLITASRVQNNSVDALDLLCYDFLDRKA